MKIIEFESERLFYRKFKLEDFPIVFDWLGNAENVKYRTRDPKTESETHEYLNRAISCLEDEESKDYRFAVVLKADNSLIGSVGIYNIPDDSEIGWVLHRNYWRQGYGTEIGKTILKFCFEILHFRRVIAQCNTQNHGSYRIMELIGMRREAHFVKARRGNSVLNYEWCDRFQYAILHEEWVAAKNKQ